MYTQCPSVFLGPVISANIWILSTTWYVLVIVIRRRCKCDDTHRVFAIVTFWLKRWRQIFGRGQLLVAHPPGYNRRRSRARTAAFQSCESTSRYPRFLRLYFHFRWFHWQRKINGLADSETCVENVRNYIALIINGTINNRNGICLLKALPA